MFLFKEDLPSVIYQYQLEQITEGDDNIVLIALAAAEEEIRSYLSPNNKREWYDGRLMYDVDAILDASGNDRHALILSHGITIAKWKLIELCNAEIIYDQAKERYDRSIDWLYRLSTGEVNLSTLPTISLETTENQNKKPFSFGSRKKFNHG